MSRLAPGVLIYLHQTLVGFSKELIAAGWSVSIYMDTGTEPESISFSAMSPPPSPEDSND